jgi:hypothetical protein
MSGSKDMMGSLDYPRLKRAYDADDYAAINFTATPDYYISGLIAYLTDPTVFDLNKGWGVFAHGQPAPPAFMAAVLPAWPPALATQVPVFEAKNLLFLANADCYVMFEKAVRVPHFILANTVFEYHRRCFMFWVVRSVGNGTLNVWIEG